MANTTCTDIKVAEGTCPLCWQNNCVSKLIPIFYKVREAVYTCENQNCIYFVTDDFGSLQKFAKSNGTSLSMTNILDPMTKSNNSNESDVPTVIPKTESTPSREVECSTSTYLDDIFNCQSQDAAVQSIINELSSELQNLF